MVSADENSHMAFPGEHGEHVFAAEGGIIADALSGAVFLCALTKTGMI